MVIYPVDSVIQPLNNRGLVPSPNSLHGLHRFTKLAVIPNPSLKPAQASSTKISTSVAVKVASVVITTVVFSQQCKNGINIA